MSITMKKIPGQFDVELRLFVLSLSLSFLVSRSHSVHFLLSNLHLSAFISQMLANNSFVQVHLVKAQSSTGARLVLQFVYTSVNESVIRTGNSCWFSFDCLL